MMYEAILCVPLSQNLKLIFEKHVLNENGFEIDMKEAIQSYKIHWENFDVEDIDGGDVKGI